MLLWKKWLRMISDEIQREFQSLFSWMLLWKSSWVKFLPILGTSFNPCSLGCCSERSCRGGPGWGLSLFQSLFSWMLLWKASLPQDSIGEGREVSILVLLDVALKGAFADLEVESGDICFNPCSLGCCSESFAVSWVYYSVQDPVSILVLLDVALKADHIQQEHGVTKTGFNPCSLGCCSESGTGGDLGNWTSGFNPCSLGCCSERCAGSTAGRVHSTMFQSLFSWMLLWKRSRRKSSDCTRRSVSILVLLDVALKVVFCSQCRIDIYSFNPCSLGCCSESCMKARISIGRMGFQSLFSWMLLWKLLQRIQTRP